MDGVVSFAPFLPWPLLLGLVGLAALGVALALWRGLSGWALRGLGMAVLLLALANPSWRQEDRAPLPDIAFVVTDRSSSQSIDIRPGQIDGLLPQLDAALDAFRSGDAPLDIRRIELGDARAEAGGAAEGGTRLLSALAEAMAEVPRDRIAGAIILSDGQIHDPDALATFPAPVHHLMTGRTDEWDRRLVLETAPAYAVIGEPVTLGLRVETIGPAPGPDSDLPLEVTVGGGATQRFLVPQGESVQLELELGNAGLNVIHLSVPATEGELTRRNNDAVVQINGIRDRLRVLLVSGEPYAGERTWRNLLKADASVDLVHFTILRPPSKQDGVPVFELSLIAFPTRELFIEKVTEFDLIIFDRYRRRGVLPTPYLDNIVSYVEEGGAVLVASGPAFAGVESLYRTPLASILPVRPTGNVLQEGYRPAISDLGARHPVTWDLAEAVTAATTESDAAQTVAGPDWGRWFRLIEAEQLSGTVVMTGPDGRPLLVLDRPGAGRIAVLASDHAWLWSRGFEGGGPQAELLRRLAHWLMKEPELEEEALTARADGGEFVLRRRTLEESVPPVTVDTPGGDRLEAQMVETAPGDWQVRVPAEAHGIYRVEQGDLVTVAAMGPSAPREFENPVASPDLLAPLVDGSRGGTFRLAKTGLPALRSVPEGRVAAGRGWMGLAERNAYRVTDIRLTSLAPGWLALLLFALFSVAAWRREGR
ncbi:hypothetical protein [Oceanomicrobium pacificus]|uniref:Glutamine amidotransferase domain-containing protein n=1 Tax=Oceanomicrobium pacificus TaxID=2692916 RepID=A0A6B0TVG8_9RHOB|nr:hypothetical protein [Oceanomicrobium pacificus]MXU64973.1 hypothetical protein [Oceanomicrobium pacificus]